MENAQAGGLANVRAAGTAASKSLPATLRKPPSSEEPSTVPNTYSKLVVMTHPKETSSPFSRVTCALFRRGEHWTLAVLFYGHDTEDLSNGGMPDRHLVVEAEERATLNVVGVKGDLSHPEARVF